MTDRQRMFDYLDGVADGLNESRNDVADVLEKIKDEIKARCCITVGSDDSPAMTLYDVFKIIDKYKAESHPQEREGQA